MKTEATKGSFLFNGPGRYQPPPSYFLIRGDPESRGSLMKPGFISVITYGNPPTELPPPTAGSRAHESSRSRWLTAQPLRHRSARPLRIIAEYLGPLRHFRREHIRDTIVFFGSARLTVDGPMAHVYRDARELARLVTIWSSIRSTSPGGPSRPA